MLNVKHTPLQRITLHDILNYYTCLSHSSSRQWQACGIMLKVHAKQ